MRLNELRIDQKKIQWLVPSILVYLIWVLYILLYTLRLGFKIYPQIFISLPVVSFIPLGYLFYRVLQSSRSYSSHIVNILITAVVFCTLYIGHVYLESISLGIPFDAYSYIVGVGFVSWIATIGYALWIFFFSLVHTIHTRYYSKIQIQK